MTETTFFMCLYLCEREREGGGGDEAQTELIYRETAASHC